MSESRRQSTDMKYFLPRLAFDDPPKFVQVFGGAQGAAALAALWDKIGESHSEENRVPSAGLSTTLLTDAGFPKLVITMPEPLHRSEPYFACFVKAGVHARWFLLELGLHPNGETTTVLAELRPDGRANWGGGPPADLHAFASRVEEVCLDAAGQPLTFIPMPLA